MKITSWIALACALIACTPTKPKEPEFSQLNTDFTKTNWLIGTWINKSLRVTNYEAWKKGNDSTLVGRSYTVKGGDTIFLEHIKLVRQGDEIHYIPTVPDQNSGMPVTFKMTFLDSNKFVFENQAHDFPQTIAYHKLSQDSLVAVISGMANGEYREHKFPMRRVE
jgi:hypothetical protein